MPDQNAIQIFGTTLSRLCYQNTSAFCVRWVNRSVEFLSAIPSGEAHPFGVYALAAGVCFPLFNKFMNRFERNFQVSHEIEDKSANRSLTGRQLLFKHLFINIITPTLCIMALNSVISTLTSYKLNNADTLTVVATVIAVRLFFLRPLPTLVPHVSVSALPAAPV